MEERIMSAISDFAGRVNTAFDTLNASATSLGDAITNLATDVTWLKDEITRLQNTPGPISAEDQALLDGLETRANAAVVSAEAAKTAAEALAASTEQPPVPTPPSTPEA
jgi:peptidoglycan hydrolase CwlO-like protein